MFSKQTHLILLFATFLVLLTTPIKATPIPVAAPEPNPQRITRVVSGAIRDISNTVGQVAGNVNQQPQQQAPAAAAAGGRGRRPAA
ncbi:hypothetical protein HK102_000517, partial [Quaeritorhiza haematococci]